MKSLILIIVLAALGACVTLFGVDCSVCGGDGTLDGTKEVSIRCESCGGSGQADNTNKGSLLSGKGVKKLGSSKRKCLKCRGTGEVTKILPLGECDVCTGKGSVKLYRRFISVK